jgi:hypothetical protein
VRESVTPKNPAPSPNGAFLSAKEYYTEAHADAATCRIGQRGFGLAQVHGSEPVGGYFLTP